MCVRVSVCGVINAIAANWLKLRTSNMTNVFPWSVQIMDPENFLKRGRGQRHVTPEIVNEVVIAPKQLKLRTSNLTNVFPGSVQTWSLKMFEKGRHRGHVTCEIFRH